MIGGLEKTSKHYTELLPRISQNSVKGNGRKLFVHDLGFLEKSLQHKMVHGDPSFLQIDPRWSLDAPWVLLGSPKNKFGIGKIQKSEANEIQNVQRRAPSNHRDLSGRDPLNIHGVPFGDKSDLQIFQTIFPLTEKQLRPHRNLPQTTHPKTHGNHPKTTPPKQPTPLPSSQSVSDAPRATRPCHLSTSPVIA